MNIAPEIFPGNKVYFHTGVFSHHQCVGVGVKVLLTFIAGLIFQLAANAVCADSMKAPWEFEKNSPVVKISKILLPETALLLGIKTYRKFVSPVMSGRSCPMHPSCSRFAEAAIKKYGVIFGGFMALDRLHRCGHDLHQYRKIQVEGSIRCQDPVP